MRSVKRIQILITVVAITIAIVHIIWPSIKIDIITITLIIIAVVPWLAPLFKSLELPGGIKFEFQELKRVEAEAKSAGLVKDEPVKVSQEYSFLEIAESDPRLALAGLRIELEKSLKSLASSKGIKPTRRGFSFLIHNLYKKQIISNQERSALADMIGTLNRAVHGEDLDYRTTQWVINIAPQILTNINKKVN